MEKRKLLVAVALAVVACAVALLVLPSLLFRLDVAEVKGGRLLRRGGKLVIEVPYHSSFEVVFKTSPLASGMRVECYCDTVNYMEPHPLRGRVCGGYCDRVESDGTCVSRSWYADAPPGIVMGLKCYLIKDRVRVPGSEVEIYLLSTRKVAPTTP